MPKHLLEGTITFRPEAYGAKGDGVADDTAAVRAAFDAANALARAGLTATIFHPGATVLLTGTYNLASLAAPLVIRCNVAENRATFLSPAAYAGVTVLAGESVSGRYFTNAEICFPDVVKPTGTGIVAGSVGVRVQNIGNSILKFGRTYYQETGLHFTGLGQGTVYNQINIGHLSYCKVAVLIKPLAGGWVNQNTFIGGGIQQSPNYDGGGIRRAGWRHVVIDGGGINACDMNTFIGTSFEGDASEYTIELRQAIYNTFRNNRFEQGTAGVPVTVSGSTLTAAAHGLAVGDIVTFSASSVPGGMILSTPYFVTSVPTVDTYTVSQKKGGAALTFSSAGTSVVHFRPARVLVDSTNSLTSNNIIENYFAVQGALEIVDAVGAGSGNVANPAGRTIRDNYFDNDYPAFAARNRKSAAVTRALFAAYPPAVKPSDNPNGWSAALSDRGVLFAASETESGRLDGSSGALTWRRPADTMAYDVPSAVRTPGLVAVTALDCAANTTTAVTLALTGASVNDHVNITMLNHVAGIAVSHGFVSAAGVVTVVFANLTAATISLSTTLQAMATRRFY